jgi:heptosyltransferase-2
VHFHSIRKVLVLQTAFAGDVVLVTPLARAIKQAYPNAEIYFLVIPKIDILLKNNPFIEKVWVFDKRGRERGLLPFLAWVKKLRSEHFDTAIVPHRSIRSAILVWAAKIPRRIGFHTSAGSFLWTDVVRYSKNIQEVERNFKLVQVLGITIPAEPPELFPGEQERDEVDLFLKKANIGPGQKMVAMAPGSVWPTKRWLPDGFVQVSRSLWQEKRIRTVLIGGESDVDLGDQIVLQAGAGPVNAMGRLSLLASAELIRRCCVILSTDSAPLHLGVAMGIPVVAIFGPTVPEFGFGPYGERHTVIQKDMSCRPCSIHGGKRCPKGHFDCMASISWREVHQAIEESLLNCHQSL